MRGDRDGERWPGRRDRRSMSQGTGAVGCWRAVVRGRSKRRMAAARQGPASDGGEGLWVLETRDWIGARGTGSGWD